MSNRKKRSDSTDVMVAAFQAAGTTMEPPSYLNVDAEARPFWDDIIATRALHNWTPHDLIVAANLARVYRDIEKYLSIVGRSRITKGQDGKLEIIAPHKVLNDLMPQAAAMARSIQVHARATQGESREQTRTNAVYRQAQQVLQNFDHSLLAKTTH
jgi:hypothetical protein